MDHVLFFFLRANKCRAATGKDADAKMSLGEKMMAGAFSALPATALMAPVERIKCLLQIQGEEVRCERRCGLPTVCMLARMQACVRCAFFPAVRVLMLNAWGGFAAVCLPTYVCVPGESGSWDRDIYVYAVVSLPLFVVCGLLFFFYGPSSVRLTCGGDACNRCVFGGDPRWRLSPRF